MERQPRFGLAYQSGVLVLLSLIVFGIISGLIIRNKYTESLKKDLISRGENIAKAIASAVYDSNPLAAEDRLTFMLHGYRDMDEVVYIFLIRRGGGLGIHTFEDSIPPQVMNLVSSHGPPRIRELLYSPERGVVDIPLYIPQGPFSYVHVGMNSKIIQRHLERVPLIVLRIFLVSLFCALSVAVIVYFKAIRPIQRLVKAIREMDRGQLVGRIPITSRDEMGVLARSLEQMFMDLQEYHKELRRKTEELQVSKEELQRQNQELIIKTEELKRAQDHLIKSEKFASMGQLAASVAHEISNPLAGILTYLKLMRRKLDQGQDLVGNREIYRKYLLTMEKETERCGNIVKNLLDFARSSEPNLREISINRVIEDTLFLINYKLLMSDIVVKKDLRDVPHIVGDFGQLKQVFLNVFLNAIEAMKGEEKVLYIETSFNETKGEVQVRIRDTGEGISSENLYKIYDPFFTTKPKGTGMGLAVVYGILDKHRAEIRIESELGKGTTVIIDLPSVLSARKSLAVGEARP